MTLPRFRVRTLLILILLAGTGAWGYALWMRAAEYRRLSDVYARFEAQEDREIASRTPSGELIPDPDFPQLPEAFAVPGREILERAKRAKIGYGRLRQKYDRAARYPWLSLPPDSPSPDQ
jgi:hypothetical protein